MDTEYSFGDEVHTFCLKLAPGILFQFWMALSVIHYLAFVKNMGTLKFKSCLYCCVFVCLQSLLQSQATHLETRKHTKPMDIYQSQITNMTFWTGWGKLLFPKRSAKVIDGSEKCNHQWAFESQNLCVFEKCSKQGSNKHCFIDGHLLGQTYSIYASSSPASEYGPLTPQKW